MWAMMLDRGCAGDCRSEEVNFAEAGMGIVINCELDCRCWKDRVRNFAVEGYRAGFGMKGRNDLGGLVQIGSAIHLSVVLKSHWQVERVTDGYCRVVVNSG